MDGRVLAVVDAVDDHDLATIMEAADHLLLVTGGSGLAQGLPPREGSDPRRIPVTAGRRAVVCGSASARTREQIAVAKRTMPYRKLQIERLGADLDAEVTDIARWAENVWATEPDAVPMVFSVETLADLTDTGHTTDGATSDLVETALAHIAARLVDAGLRQCLVAGGETSGRVIQQLGITALRIGPALGPGIAWSSGICADGTPLTVALKSGNFGAPDLFTTAWGALDPADIVGHSE